VIVTSVEKLKIHFFYCVVIMTSICILIATDRWSGSARFTEYLSNAATMTSLLLGLVAIFYSFIANDGLSKSLGNISTVANEVRESKEEISNFISLTADSTENARANTAAMQVVSTQINGSLAALTNTLEDIRTQTAALNSAVTAIPTRFDQLETSFNLVARTIGEKAQVATTPVTDQLPNERVRRFLATTSLTTNLLTYACVAAKQKGKNLSLEKLSILLGGNYTTWLSANISVMMGIELISGKRIPEDEVSVSWVHGYLESNAQSYFVNYVNSHFANDTENRDKWIKRINDVDALFE
jgi:hypothetical protein